jgi:hypothetical protein
LAAGFTQGDAVEMAEYTLHCFAQSGNCYKAALMLALSGADWEPVWVDFFNGETRNPNGARRSMRWVRRPFYNTAQND